MSKIISLLVFVALFVVSTAEAQAPYIERPQGCPTDDVRSMIECYSEIYGANKAVLLKMAECESGFDGNKKGDYLNGVYLAQGLYQYHQETWKRHTGYMGETLNKNSPQDQAKLVAWISVNGPSALNEWTSYVAIKNGGTYSFYSKLLKRSYTVVCKL